jgi:hypothetical protein
MFEQQRRDMLKALVRAQQANVNNPIQDAIAEQHRRNMQLGSLSDQTLGQSMLSEHVINAAGFVGIAETESVDRTQGLKSPRSK